LPFWYHAAPRQSVRRCSTVLFSIIIGAAQNGDPFFANAGAPQLVEGARLAMIYPRPRPPRSEKVRASRSASIPITWLAIRGRYRRCPRSDADYADNMLELQGAPELHLFETRR
jgi:hypothetical protein